MSTPQPTLVAVPAAVPDDLRLSRLEALLDPVFLSEAGWDAKRALLRPSPDHRLLGWSQCSVPGCTVETSNQLCTGCRSRQADSGLSPEQFIASAPVQKHGGAEGRWLFDQRLCRVDGCQRPMHARTLGLCNSHTLRCRELFGRLDRVDVPLFLERSDVRPFPSWGPCRVAACLRLAYNSAGLCLLHSQRWHETLRSDVDADLVEWCRREDGITVSGVANLRGLPRAVVLEFLGGLQLRAGQGRKLRPSQANRLARAARYQQVASLRELDLDGLGEDVKTLVAMLLPPEADQKNLDALARARRRRQQPDCRAAAARACTTLKTKH